MRKIFVTCLIAIYVSVGGVVLGEDKAKITIKTIDEEGKSVVGMPVSVTFYAGAKNKGVTDTNGLFSLEGDAESGEAWYGTRKESYYESMGGYQFSKPIDGRWQPWNPVITSVVRRIVNPIPMYAKRVETIIPSTNQYCGFDLEIGDWIVPYGKGTTCDLNFYLARRMTSSEDYEGTLILTFTNGLEGIEEIQGAVKESAFRSPRFAPESGYQTNYVVCHGKDPKKGYYGALVGDVKKSHFFRIRSILDERGNLKEALYGKTVGEIEIGGVAAAQVRLMFTYYLNPTPNDRNMEFDPKRNLMRNLKSTEQVNMP